MVSSVQSNLSVPSLNHYFDAGNTSFPLKDFVASDAQVIETVNSLTSSARESFSPSSSHDRVGPATTAGNKEQIPSDALKDHPTKAPLFSFAGIEKLFYNGTPTSGNDTSLYIQIPSTENEGGVSSGSEFWVSVTWEKILPKLFEIPVLFHEVLKQIKGQPDFKERALQVIQGYADRPTDAKAGSGCSTDTGDTVTKPVISASDPFNTSAPDTATFSSFSSAPTTSSQPFLFSELGSARYQDSRDSSVSAHSRQGTNSSWMLSPVRGDYNTSIFSMQQQQLLQAPNGIYTASVEPQAWAMNTIQPSEMHYSLPAMPAPAPGVDELIKRHLSKAYIEPAKNINDSTPEDLTNSSGVTVFTARTDTIDPFLLAQSDVMHNEETLEYVWSKTDSTLYKLQSLQGQQAITESGSIHLIFPPKTMLLTYEKDGSLATPAYSNLHPHSNEWLKSQVCHRSCPYRAGTASLKRPKTVREHFRKCVYLDEKHPLKILSALQLSVLEREANGQLPNRRRAKVIRRATESANRLY